MSKLRRFVSFSVALVLLLALGMPQAYAVSGNINDFAQTCTFDDFDVTTLGAVITSDNATVTVETVDGDNAVKVDCTGAVYPWFYMYSGAATTGNLSFKFDFKVETGSMTFGLRARFADKTEPILLGLDHGAVDCLGNEAVFRYSKNTWYNAEVYIDNRAGKALLRFKADADTAWSEKWVDDMTAFTSNMNSNTGFIGLYMKTIKTYASTDAAWYIDNYSHSVSSAGFKNLNTYFGGYAMPATFSETEELSYYVETANISGNSKVTIAADPLEHANSVLKLHADGSNPFVMPLNSSTDTGNSLHTVFDFYNPNGAKMMLRLYLEGAKQPLVILLEDGTVKMTNDKTVTSLTYTTDKWYTASLDMNWKNNYLNIGLKEKGADEFTYATVPFCTEFVNYSDLKLVQIRLGYFTKPGSASDLYIDNYTHSTSSEVAETADVTKAIKPKAVKTGDIVTSVISHAMTLSGTEKPVKLIVALYDSEGALSDVVWSDDRKCSTTEGTPLSVDLTEKKFSSWKGFVWSNLQTIAPIELINVNNW